MHFLTSGGLLQEKRQPHPLFDVNFYAKEYRDDLRPDTNLLLDFLANGLARGRLPHRLFDPAYYLRSARTIRCCMRMRSSTTC